MTILKKIKNRVEKIKERTRKFFGVRLIKSLRDLIIFQQTIELQNKHPNPLNSYGKKGFSQTDEDGITLEIIKRMGIKKGIFAEFMPPLPKPTPPLRLRVLLTIYILYCENF